MVGMQKHCSHALAFSHTLTPLHSRTLKNYLVKLSLPNRSILPSYFTISPFDEFKNMIGFSIGFVGNEILNLTFFCK